MKSKDIFSLFALIAIFSGYAPEAMAVSTNACHCFKDRAYNPAAPFAADDYILATSFNSLLSRAYDIPKKQLVFLKMQGGAGHKDLIVALEAAKKSGVDLAQLLQLRQKQPWQQILFQPGISEKIRGDEPLTALAKGGSIDAAVPRIADRLLADFFKFGEQEIAELRAAGLGEREMALVFILSRAKDQKPTALAERYSKMGKSWSTVAHELGVAPAEAGKLILDFGG